MSRIRKGMYALALTGALVVIPAGVASAASNASVAGLPSQSCQDVTASGGITPGNSALSPGSPFDEPGTLTTDGGIGGQHYNEISQYDVACFQVSQPH